MHILFLNSARRWGGNEKWTLMAAGALGEQERATVAWRADEIGRRLPSHIGSLRLPFVSEADVVTLGRLYHFVQREKVDIIVSTKRKDYVTGALLSLLTGARHFVRLGIVRPLPDTLINRFIFKRHCAGIIVNAARIKEELTRGAFIGESRVHVVYNGVDFGALERAAEKPAEKPFPFMLAASGLLIPRKGFDVVLEGFKKWMDDGRKKEAGLWILGDGPEAQRLRDQGREYGLEKHLFFCGYQTNPYAYYAAADVFVLLSDNEGISNALLEAMYLRCAAVTTRAGGAEQVIASGEEGWLIERDSDALSAVLARIYDDRELSAGLRQRGREKVREIFSMEKMKNTLLRIFREN